MEKDLLDNKPIHWKGYMTADNMRNNPDWLPHWAQKAMEAEQNGNGLYIFELPENSFSLVAKIDLLIQEEIAAKKRS